MTDADRSELVLYGGSPQTTAPCYYGEASLCVWLVPMGAMYRTNATGESLSMVAKASRKLSDDSDNPVLLWTSQDASEIPFQFLVAHSVITEFAAGHDPAAVMRELVQNDYDAESKRLEIAFGVQALTIRGHGNPVDEQGWKRLSVMLGTGRIPGTQTAIQQKVNGIGSKNFGLRSLFLFGNRINVVSNGKWTALDIEKGALAQPLRDPSSINRAGIHIEVPYRTKKLDRLEPFSKEMEEQALSRFVDELTPTLLKLASLGSSKSLQEVVISSTRCKREIRWSQWVRRVACRQRGISVVRRSIRVSDSTSSEPHTLKELEFQRVLSHPAQHRRHPVPGYFQVAGGRIRVSVSVRVAARRDTMLLNEPGRFYYPIGVGQGFTGCAVSVNAPFDMDADRSQILAPDISPWNTWLLNAAADLILDLLVGDWLQRFGADAYLALRPQFTPATAHLMDTLARRMASEPIWPTRARLNRTSKRPKFAKAADLVVPERVAFEGFANGENELDVMLSRNAEGAQMVREAGAQRFSLNSLVALRSFRAGARLSTKLMTDEANRHYVDFSGALTGLALQEQFASAFDAAHKNLSKDNKQDILSSASTLTAAGTLRPLSELWFVDATLDNVILVPDTERIHPALTHYRTLAQLSPKPFDVSAWLEDVAEKARKGTITEEERASAYRYLISPDRKLKASVFEKVRNAPLLRDHRGNWTVPCEIILPNAQGARELECILHLPHPDYRDDVKLSRRLRFRKHIGETDLVDYANYVAQYPDLVEKFERILVRFDHLLTSAVVEKLSMIPCLRSSHGVLAPPRRLHLKTPTTLACLGSGGSFVEGTRASLYRKLGCLAQASSQAIVEHLDTLRDESEPPQHPQIIYPALVAALKAEHQPLTRYAESPVLWTGDEYEKPALVLLSAKHKSTFLEAVPCVAVPSAQLRTAYAALGAHDAPEEQHWLRLFTWLDGQYLEQSQQLSSKEQFALRSAYAAIGAASLQVPDKLRWLLDRSGRLWSISDLHSGRFVRNDDPALADACADLHADIAFAQIDGPRMEKVASFFRALCLRNLTDVSKRIGILIGPERPAPHWFKLTDTLSKLHSADFRSALHTSIAHRFHHMEFSPSDHLARIQRISFAQWVEVRYSVHGSEVTVRREVALEDDQIVLTRVHSYQELYNLLGYAIASLVVSEETTQREFADFVTMLLTQETHRDLVAYMRRRGIAWTPPNSANGGEPPLDGDEDVSEPEEINNPAINVVESNNERFVAALIDSVSEHLARAVSSDSLEPIDDTDVDVAADPHPPSYPATSAPLRPLAEVSARSKEPTGVLQARASSESRRSSSNWARGSSFHLISDERRRELGERGEQLVYDQLVHVVTERSQSSELVVWVSKNFPTADHDIRSVDENGNDIYVEVKSTTEKHGVFDWSFTEFKKAIELRERYILVRVYEVDSERPTIMWFRDPIGYLERHELRLNVANLRAEVEGI